jgi:hypothetical protein
MLTMMALVPEMYPAAVADQAFLDEATTVAADPALAPLIQQGLVHGNDLLARRLRSRSL